MAIISENKVTILNISSTIILQGLTFFSGPIFSSMLGPDNYGIVSIYLTWVSLASTVFTLQAGSTLAIARSNFPMERQKEYQSSVLSLATIAYSVFSVIILLGIAVISKHYTLNMLLIFCGLLHGWGMYCVQFANAKFTYEFRADKNLILSVLILLLSIVLSVFLIKLIPTNEKYWGRVVGLTVIYVIVGIGIYIGICRTGKVIYNKNYWVFTLAIPTMFHLLANLVLNQSDKLMIQGMMNESDVGIYSLACSFGAVLNTIWSALNNSWVPFYYEYTRTDQIDKIKYHAKNYIELFTIIAMGFILLSKEVFHIYASREFWEGTDLVPLFAIGQYFIFMYSFPVNYEFYNKKTKLVAIGTILAAFCNVTMNFILIKCIGIKGAVVATTLSFGLQFIFHYILADKTILGNLPFRLKEFIPGFIAVCCSFCLYWVTREFWMIRWGIGLILAIFLLTKIVKRKEIF